ncbi:MAG: Hsp33 family molecular chaperone HslO [Eubacteriales bacterium]|nr:Hsp33 family molecular chaperone HslO [Eubacteriales bacterium]MDY3332301.1 Hsp33 family molecular chaperone HslO [Gallibacter sp.]
MSKNKVLVAVDKSGSYRVYLTITTAMVEEARVVHGCTPLATACLGRVLTATGLMAQDLKADDNRMTVIFKGDGEAKEILATAYGDGRIKGYISNPQVDMPLRTDCKLDVGGAIGIGELTVIKDFGLKDPYIGQIALVNGEIAEDLTAYYYISEQQNTSISLGVKVGKNLSVLSAGGMFLQLLPNCDERVIEVLEKCLGEMKPISQLIEAVQLRSVGKTDNAILEELLKYMFATIDEEFMPETLDFKEIDYTCDCSRDRMHDALMTIGKSDLEEILKEDGQAELVCNFCNERYLFNADDIKEMIDSI